MARAGKNAQKAIAADGAAVQVERTGNATALAGSVAVTGFVGELTVIQPRAPRGPASWPHAVGRVQSRAQSFQNRAAAEELRAAVNGGGTAVLDQVLTGMGGVGKTQLAADYARAAWERGELDVLVWVTASTRQAIVDRFAQAGQKLCRADPDDVEQAACTFLAWLMPRHGAQRCRWLVVLDDVTDPDDLRDLWPPASLHGRTLITTRRRDAALAGHGRRLVTVGLFTEAEAVAHLAASLAAHGCTEPKAELVALARELGRLPLALSQAAAYLADSGASVAAYRSLLTAQSTRLTDVAPDRLPDEQFLPLAAAWSLSAERADTLHPAGMASPMLQLAAHLDANGIPHAVLTSEPALSYLTRYRTRQHTTEELGRASPADATLSLRALHRLNPIDHTPTSPHQTVRVHQLIQRATRDTLTPDQRHETACAAADALVATWPELWLEGHTALTQALRANATALTTCAEDALYRPDAHMVLYHMGTSLGQAGQTTAAVDYFRHLVNTTTSRLGPDHPDTLSARHALARWRTEAGDAAGATIALAELLEDTVRVLGPDHHETLSARANIARARGEAGDAAGAAAAFADLLADVVRVIGPDGYHTLLIRFSLAHWQGEAGDATGAVTSFADLLTDMARVLGPENPHTLHTRNNLARWRGQAGDVAGAITAYEALLADQVRVQGPDHLFTLAVRNNLANLRGEAGDAAGAVAAQSELLADRVRVLGPDHPHTLATRDSLPRWQGETKSRGRS